MAQEQQDIQYSETRSNADSFLTVSSFITPQKQAKKIKRQKKMAFQSFLSKPDIQQSEPPSTKRKYSDSEKRQQDEKQVKMCKICSKQIRDKKKLCQFCKQELCLGHFRKARRNPQTNKFTRICDYCEDKYLMEKYHKNFLKSQEGIVTQEEMVQNKYNKLKEELEKKREQYFALTRKKQRIKSVCQRNFEENLSIKKQIDAPLSKINAQLQQLSQFDAQLQLIQKQLPHSLQNDFKVLQKQKDRLTKDYNKANRQFETLLKAKTIKQKQMYEDLYDWQVMQKLKIDSDKKKQEEQCLIY